MAFWDFLTGGEDKLPPVAGDDVPTRHIAWQEVIELDTKIPADERQKLGAALSAIEARPFGQKKFAESLAIQEHIRTAGLPAEKQLSQPNENERAFKENRTHQKEQSKIFISTVH